jgi:NAD(P)-dependent dehydrogenase (short-subunit alcohol dehydrogenase family)
MSAYCASKFGLMGFMESLAGEVRDAGIHCSTICPGSILTDFGGRSAAEKASASGARFISPGDVAAAIVYLLQQPRRAWTQEMNLWPF